MRDDLRRWQTAVLKTWRGIEKLRKSVQQVRYKEELISGGEH